MRSHGEEVVCAKAWLHKASVGIRFNVLVYILALVLDGISVLVSRLNSRVIHP